jgi:hypothetical protein
VKTEEGEGEVVGVGEPACQGTRGGRGPGSPGQVGLRVGPVQAHHVLGETG